MSSTGTQLATHSSTVPKRQLRVLMVEDNQLDAELALRALRKDNFEVSAVIVQDEAAFEQALRTHSPEIVLADYNLPGWKGMEALGVLRRQGLEIPMILVSGALGDVTAVECIRQGATDYVLKDGLARLPQVVHRALREQYDRGLRHQAEKDLAKKADELARSNADLEQFAYVASHDLQEPLRKIQAFGDRLKTKYDAALGSEGLDYLTRMQNAAARMQALIQDLLSLSRVASNTKPFTAVDLGDVVRVVVSDLEVHAQERNGRVEAADLPVVFGDRGQLAQLFQNLIGNGLKFQKPGESPVVKVSSEAVTPSDGSGASWRITVEDNGIGFDEKYSERIFQIFQRLHGRSEYEGTGIGLAICRKIVERHGGAIAAHSSPGAGAKFVITLPQRDSGAN